MNNPFYKESFDSSEEEMPYRRREHYRRPHDYGVKVDILNFEGGLNFDEFID